MASRRHFLKNSLITGAWASSGISHAPMLKGEGTPGDEELKSIYNQPVVVSSAFAEPVIIEQVDLIKIDNEYLIRARSKDGAAGYAVSNWGMANFYPVFLKHVAPFFEGKDARYIDDLIHECFLEGSHYKMQSMAIWTPVAAAEMAILDLLGNHFQQPVHQFMGGLARKEVEIYWANNYRGQSAEASVRQIAEKYEREKPPAVKVKIAGRMGAPEKPSGRSEKLIPLLRKTLGDRVVIYADANGGYDVKAAIRMGKILEESGIAFFEEPCPFYDLWETKAVADALSIPVAAGEQESSARRFRWMIANRGAGVLQPDLFYYGGLIRSMKVARMAAAAGMPCTPHVSGGGMNMLYITHFAGMVPNAGPHQEYKSPNASIPYEMMDGHMVARNGRLKVPNAPGFGFRLDPDWVKRGKLLSTDMLL